MVRTYNFLAPSLHPNTLLDICIPEPGPSSAALEPIVKHLPIKHHEFSAVGTIKRLHQTQDGNVSYIVAGAKGQGAHGSSSLQTIHSE